MLPLVFFFGEQAAEDGGVDSLYRFAGRLVGLALRSNDEGSRWPPSKGRGLVLGVRLVPSVCKMLLSEEEDLSQFKPDLEDLRHVAHGLFNSFRKWHRFQLAEQPKQCCGSGPDQSDLAAVEAEGAGPAQKGSKAEPGRCYRLKTMEPNCLVNGAKLVIVAALAGRGAMMACDSPGGGNSAGGGGGGGGAGVCRLVVTNVVDSRSFYATRVDEGGGEIPWDEVTVAVRNTSDDSLRNDLSYGLDFKSDSRCYMVHDIIKALSPHDSQGRGMRETLASATSARTSSELPSSSHHTQVTSDNVDMWIEEMVNKMLRDDVKQYVHEMRTGMLETMGESVMRFRAPPSAGGDAGGGGGARPEKEPWEVLRDQLGGVLEVHVAEWRRATTCFPQNHDQVRWFWEMVREMHNDERLELLKFVTEKPAFPFIPPGSEQKVMKLVVKCRPGEEMDGRLPTTRTCFGQLTLYRYSSAEAQREKLRQAIQEWRASKHWQGYTDV